MRERGQAAVETALGILVFVSILVWGIHLSEIGFLAPKVHEAAAAAMWDTTAERMHIHPNDYSPRQNAVGAAGSGASSRYSNYDGRSSVSGGPAPQVFTRPGGLTTQCDFDPLVNMDQRRLQAFPGGNGGMACYGNGSFQVINFPREFMDQGSEGFFKVKNYPPGLNTITVCAMGRGDNGDCSAGKLAMLLDDWGLAGAPNENRDCTLDGCVNTPFRDLIHRVYSQTGAEGAYAGRAMAMSIVGMAAGGPEGRFWMSYYDRPDPGMTGGDQDPTNWVTNVVDNSRNPNYQRRQERARFLGIRDVIP